LSYLIPLRNKSPKYNEGKNQFSIIRFSVYISSETKTYVLQFTGNRVAQPSVKNFQMVIENENRMFSKDFNSLINQFI
jgi:hypothetical protein